MWRRRKCRHARAQGGPRVRKRRRRPCRAPRLATAACQLAVRPLSTQLPSFVPALRPSPAQPSPPRPAPPNLALGHCGICTVEVAGDLGRPGNTTWPRRDARLPGTHGGACLLATRRRAAVPRGWQRLGERGQRGRQARQVRQGGLAQAGAGWRGLGREGRGWLPASGLARGILPPCPRRHPRPASRAGLACCWPLE